MHTRACLRASVWVPGSVGVVMNVRACSLAYSARNAYGPHCDVICSLWLHPVFRRYHINGMIFEKRSFWTWNVCFDFLSSFVWNISNSKNNSERYCHKCENFFIKSPRYSCRILMKLEFSLQICEKCLNIGFHRNPSNEKRVVPCGSTEGRTDGHYEAISRFSQFCESA